MNIFEPVREQARLQPDAVALARGRWKMNYAQLDAATRRIASILAAEGLGRGDIVGTCILSSPAFLIVSLGLARLGAVTVALHPNLPAAERKAIADHLEVGAVITLGKRFAVEGRRMIAVAPIRGKSEGATAEHHADFEGGDGGYRIVLSSGTTGMPKAVLRTHERALVSMDLLNGERAIDRGVRYLCRMDLNTGVALNEAVRYLGAGACLIFVGGKDIIDVFEAIERHKVREALVSPAMLERWVAALPDNRLRFPQIARLTVGGGRLRESLWRQVVERLTPSVYTNYGMSEAGSVAAADPEMLRRLPECAGRPHPWLDVEVADDDDVSLPPGEAGIVRMRGKCVAEAYYRNPEATRKAFRNGWYYSNDIGRFTPDGILTIEARADDVIVLDGIKVNPARIEDVLSRHPDVVESAAFAEPSTAGGSVLAAAVVIRGAFDEQLLRQYCQDQLGRNAPRRIYAVPKLPRTTTGKILRRDLPQQVAQGKPGARTLTQSGD